MKSLVITDSGSLLSLDIPTDTVAKAISEAGVLASDMLILVINKSGCSTFVNATSLPFVSAIDLVIDSAEPNSPPHITTIRALSPSFLKESTKIPIRTRSQVPQYEELLARLRSIGVIVDIVVPELELEPPQNQQQEKQ